MKQIHVATSPRTNTIFAGHTLKDGRTWGAGKQDVTLEALCAVAEHGAAFGKPIVISDTDGKPVFEITVKRL